MDERRKHKRFKLDAACILFHDKSGGTIIDISMGGLSCMCLDQGKCSQGLSVQIDIYCKKHDLCAEDIRLKVIGTEMVQGKFLMEKLGTRKCRARFYQLDKSQQVQVTNIITKLPLS